MLICVKLSCVQIYFKIINLLCSLLQDYVYPDAQDRQFLRYFYKGARKKRFNVEKYNELKDKLAQVG